MAQRFYHLAGTPEHLMVDLCMRPASRAGSLTEVEQHGQARVLFDRGTFVTPRELDRAELRRQIAARRRFLRDRLPFTAFLPGKELARGRVLDAWHFYVAFNLTPLVEVLRMRHCPARFSFGMRYLAIDLPSDVAARIEDLAMIEDGADLAAKHRACRAWLEDELAGDPVATDQGSA